MKEGAPTRPGYTFHGWLYNDSEYAANDSFTMPPENVELVAQWEPAGGGGPSGGGGGGGTVVIPDPDTPRPELPPIIIPDPEVPLSPALDLDNHFAYIIGYEDGTARPKNNITRAEVATIFFRLLTQESRAENWLMINDFPDVEGDKWYNNAISTLTNAGMLRGYPDGLFRPGATITRAELATIAVRFENNGDDLTFPQGLEGFSDIGGHWAESYIKYASSLGYVNGYPDGTFKPDAPITRAEVAKLLNNVLNRHVESDDDLLAGMRTWDDNPAGTWYYFEIQEASNSHFYERKADGMNEIWTELRQNPNWALLQLPTAKPGDVVY